MPLAYVSAILNFQYGRGRPLEYYTRPLNDFAEVNPDLIVFVDDVRIFGALSSKCRRVMVNYEEVSNLDYEPAWREQFLTHFDPVWYNLSRTYLLKPKLVMMGKIIVKADRYAWLDAGMINSHVNNHDCGRYKNLYTAENVAFMTEVFSQHDFLSQGWVVNRQSGVDMEIIYQALGLSPDGREHISGCAFALDAGLVDRFNEHFYEILRKFHELKFPGTDENVYITMLASDRRYCERLFSYNQFMTRFR